MIHKEKIPITFFEKIKEGIDIIMPSFFYEPTPNIAALNTKFESDEIVKNAPKDKASIKSLIKTNEALRGIHTIKLKHINREYSYLETVNNDLFEKFQNRGGHDLLSEEEAFDFLDSIYMTNTPHYTDETGKIQPLNTPHDRKDIDRMFWTFHRFNKYGKKTFRLEEQLTQELFITDVTNVDSSFLMFPYPSICFYLPYNNKLCIRKDIIRYVYTSERIKVGAETTRIIEFLYITENENIEVQQFEITEGHFVDQIIEQVHKLFESPLAIKEASEISSFILAAILYLNSTEVSERQVFPIFFDKKSHSRFPVCSLGYNIKIDKTLHYTQNTETKGLGKPMNVLKWTVRGHFRTYKMGERWKEDKTIWIRPYLKGRERENPDQIIKPTNYLVE